MDQDHKPVTAYTWTWNNWNRSRILSGSGVDYTRTERVEFVISNHSPRTLTI